MTNINSYARYLRAIGQDIEQFCPNAVNVEADESGFIVRAETPAQQKMSQAQDSTGSGLAGIWRGWRGRGRKEEKSSGQPQGEATSLEFRYSAEDLERLDTEARARSRDSHAKPELVSLPETLRLVGAYIDQKGGKLLKVSTQDPMLTIEYRTTEGEQKNEEHQISSFYDLSVRLYLHRSDRS
ncbi:MAG: hypothetical protein ACE5HC_11730 [Candidatus Binatia bacterium]